MGYAATVGSFKKALEDAISNYEVSDDLVIANDGTVQTMSTVLTKKKEITLTTLIYSGSKFRFQFKMQNDSAGTTVYARIYKNGVAVGTLWDTASDAWETKTQDIDMGTWEINDTVELWLKGHQPTFVNCMAKEFRIFGTPSQFRNTI